MFRIWLVNFGYYLKCGERFETFDEAMAAAKASGFEARVDDECDNMVASWSPIGGTRFYRCDECGQTGWNAV